VYTLTLPRQPHHSLHPSCILFIVPSAFYSSMLAVAGTAPPTSIEHPMLVLPQSCSYKVEFLSQVSTSIVHSDTSLSADSALWQTRLDQVAVSSVNSEQAGLLLR